MEIAQLERRVARERRARQEAERLLEEKAAELFEANKKLALHAESLTQEIETTRSEVQSVRSEVREWKGQAESVKSDLERANLAAFRAEQRLWNAIEAIPDGFAVFDIDDRLVAANRAFAALFETSKVHAQSGVRYADLVRGALDAGIIDTDGKPADQIFDELIDRRINCDSAARTIHRSDGRWINLIDRRSPDGDVVSLRLDITDAKRREADLTEARRSAEAASRAKSAFLANMSHEIRTPMNGVVGMADLLCDTILSEEQRLFAETIRNSGEALLTIINDVLDYSKIEAGKFELFADPFDLERLLHDVSRLLQTKADDKKLDLLVDYDMFLPTGFVGDNGRFRQILLNLVGNAIKFTETGHVLMRVVGVPRDDGQCELHIAVIDTGIGIPEDQLDRVFGEFNQVDEKTNRRYEGTGLGLAITQRLVGLMGGHMWVESTYGEGSCFGFKVVLPVARAMEAPHIATTLKGRVLVVDDLRINRTILERQLSRLGLEVTMACSGADALQILQDNNGAAFDLLLTDQHMPAMTGTELALAAHAHWPGLPVVLLSSGAMTAPISDLAAVLQKPAMRADLARAVEAGIAGRSLNAGDVMPRDQTGIRGAEMVKHKTAQAALRVLVAEDNRTNQLVFSKMTAGLGMAVTFANNGQEAITAFETDPPDLIFMDVSMPVVDGLEATSRIRAIEAERGLERTTIVALTAHAMTGDEEMFLASGMDHYLTKPLRKAAIAKLLAELGQAGQGVIQGHG